MRSLCAKENCENMAARNQKYCCRDHAPLGNLFDPGCKPKSGFGKKRGKKPIKSKKTELDTGLEQLRNALINLIVCEPNEERDGKVKEVIHEFSFEFDF